MVDIVTKHPPLPSNVNTRVMALDISLDLSKKRGPAFYGYEAELRPASDIFSRTDADEALVSEEEVFNACNKLINEIFVDDRNKRSFHEEYKNGADSL